MLKLRQFISRSGFDYYKNCRINSSNRLHNDCGLQIADCGFLESLRSINYNGNP